MKIEKRNNHKRKIIIGGLIVTSVLIVGIFASSYSKYRVTESVKLGEGIINYSNADFEIVGMYLINEDNTETKIDVVPGDGYILNNEKTKCTVNDSEVEVSIEYKDNKLYFGDITNKGTKCTVYFNKVLDSEVPVISNVAVEKGDTSIKVTVTASDNIGVAKYYYQIGSNAVEESTSNEHTFSGLTKGQKYTVKIYVTDSAGNQSSVWSGEVSLVKASDTILAGGNVLPGTDSFTSGATTAAQSGKFTTEDNDGTTYYYRGIHDSVNNWVDFAGYKWRIIRINGDGSIRMICNGTSTATTGTSTQLGTKAYNTNHNNNMYVGFRYTSGQVHGTGTPSTILGSDNSTDATTLNGFYNTKIKGTQYEQYIDQNAGFCNDRTPSTSNTTSNGSGGTETTTTYYGPYIRLLSVTSWARTQKVTMKCNESDLFTATTANKGNKSLANPIGLATADEVVYAGGFGGNANSSYWLYTNQYYWTMTPSSYNGGAFVFCVHADGDLDVRKRVDNTYGVRPVINLSADVNIIGSGTTTDPFRIVS